MRRIDMSHMRRIDYLLLVAAIVVLVPLDLVGHFKWLVFVYAGLLVGSLLMPKTWTIDSLRRKGGKR